MYGTYFRRDNAAGIRIYLDVLCRELLLQVFEHLEVLLKGDKPR
jgi:hypothetical protein